MTETAPHKPVGFTREMREARAAAQTVGAEPEAQAGLDTGAAEAPRRITRENRRPFNSTTQKLAYPDRPSYHRHWFNDTPGRIAGALEAGYAHVSHERGPNAGRHVQAVVGRHEGGQPLTAFLMEIPQEWFDDDMAAYERQVAEKEATIKRGMVEKADPKDAQKFYPTAQGRQISLTRSAR